MSKADYWIEALASALDEVGLSRIMETIAPEHQRSIGDFLDTAHENYGMAFYSPPPSDRIAAIEREHKDALTRKDKDAEIEVSRLNETIEELRRVINEKNWTIRELREGREP